MKFSKFMYSFKAIFILLLLVSIDGIFYLEKLDATSNSVIVHKAFPKIGLLADTQITTDKGERVWYIRSKFADKFQEVAIRPPALEHLDEDILRYFLNKISDYNVDMILYLGDGANSGCTDEINALFDIMSDHRIDQKVPIYFVIGNHDYLGNGNITIIRDRKKLCGENNPPLNKFELMQKAHSFNKLNNEISDKFVYEDNFDSPSWKFRSTSFQNCSKSEDRAHIEGCFLAGRINFRDNPDFEIFLTDTSDYKDRVKPIELYGTMGSISFKELNSQIEYFNGLHSKAKVRLIASHYPPKNMSFPLSEHIGEALIGKTSSLLLENGNNCWVSAHTHHNLTVEPLGFSDRSIVKLLKFISNHKQVEEFFVHINIGSTTDYPPHAAILSYKDSKSIMVESIYGASEKRCNCESLQNADADWCKSILNDMDSNDIAIHYKEINGYEKGQIIFGLTQNYKKKYWDEKDFRYAEDNIDKFINRWTNKCSEGIKPYLISCLAIQSAIYEEQVEMNKKEIISAERKDNKAIIYRYPKKEQIDTQLNKMTDLIRALEIEKDQYNDDSREYEVISNLVERLRERKEDYLGSEKEGTKSSDSETLTLADKLLYFLEKSGKDKQIVIVPPPRGSSRTTTTDLPIMTIDIWSLMVGDGINEP